MRIEQLKSITPEIPWALITVTFFLFPAYLVGLLLNPAFYAPGELLGYLTLIGLSGILLGFLHRSRLSIGLYCLILLIGVFESIHFVLIQGPVSVASMHVIYETNLEEGLDFLRFRASWWLLLPLLQFMVGLWFISYAPGRGRGIWDRRLGAILSLSLFLWAVFLAQPSQRRLLLPTIIKATLDYRQELRRYTDLKDIRSKSQIQKIEAKLLNNAERQIYFLIIGESINRNHLSLYGYARPTTPRLREINNLIKFEDVISAYASTQFALKAALTLANQTNGRKYSESPGILEIAREAGFKTYWISNHSPIGLWDNVISLMAKGADRSWFVNLVGDSTKTNQGVSLDEKVLGPLDVSLNDPAPKKLIILHLMGAHVDYLKRYPNAFKIFTGATEDKQKTIDAYDNAVTYHDTIIAKIINRFEKRSKETGSHSAGMYFSDHGEEVYDSQDFAGHDWIRVSRHVVEIPFLIWYSDQFGMNNPGKVLAMKKAVKQPYMTDDLIHTLIDLMDVKVVGEDESLSLFSRKLKSKERMVHGRSYDKKLKYNLCVGVYRPIPIPFAVAPVPCG